MLSHKVLTRSDVGRAASYYEDSADDYYSKEGDASAWQGKGAETLGLDGAVSSERFRELLAGEIKPGAEIIRSDTRKDSNSRIGIDLTFSAPKSVSLQALVGGDGAIIRAHDRAVERAVEAAEQRAQARKKIDGKTQVENTGNLVVAKFRHETSRERDPQLHTHAVVLNMTQRSDGQWRALKNDEIIKMTKYLGAVYRAELASELTKLGYNVRHERDGMFELAHISRPQLEAFSQRSAQIEERLAAKGLTRETATPGEKQQATMESRARKVATEREEVFKDWQGRAKDLKIDFERREWAGKGVQGPETSKHSTPQEFAADVGARRSVRWAVNHLTERSAVMNERQLLDTAIKHAVGSARLQDIEAEVKRLNASGYLIRESSLYKPAENAGNETGKTREAWVGELVEKGIDSRAAKERVSMAIERGSLIETEPRYTTQTALERENGVLRIEREGRGALQPVIGADAAKLMLEATNLNPGQRSAAELIATTPNRVVGVQGYAGTGKSHMLETAKAMIEQQGFEVRALAPYGSQVKALRELGVESNTLASFLKAKEKHIDARTVLVIDEAGVVPARQMDQVLKLAEKAGARVVLMGDTAQTKAIEAGRPFDQLQAAGMATAKMDEIQRQKDPKLKEAVEHAAKGETKASLDRISTIVEIEQGATRRAAVAADYLKLQPVERDKTIIVSGTNEARREINQLVREGVGTAGKGIQFDTLIRRDTTQAERRFSKYYRVGDVIQPERDYAKTGLKRGELYKIEDTGPGNKLVVSNDKGERVSINPMQHTKLSVYQPERAELAAGDKVRITRNDAKLDVANGDRFTVERVTTGEVTLRGANRTIKLPADKPLHVDYAYAATVHSSQGLTANRVLIDAQTKSITTAKDVYYVAISRARIEARIYTDSVRDLPKAIARENVKLAALDLERGRRVRQEAERSKEQEKSRTKGGQERQEKAAGSTGQQAKGEQQKAPQERAQRTQGVQRESAAPQQKAARGAEKPNKSESREKG